MDARAELQHLLADLFDGAPDRARNQRLDDLLCAHPDLHGEYLDYLQLHALLQWRGGKVAPQPSPKSEPGNAEPVSLARAAGSGKGASRWRSGRSLAAALLFVAASIAIVFLWMAPEAQATPDLFEHLIDWNLDLTQARSADERSRIYDEQAASLKEKLAKADLPAEDRKLAESLLETGTMLAKKVDPAAEAERFDDLADKLAARMETATAQNDERRVVQLADAITRLTEVGVKANWKHAQAASGLDADRKHKFAQSTLRDTNRDTYVAQIIDRNPEPARKAIHRAMKGHFHKTKKFKNRTE